MLVIFEDTAYSVSCYSLVSSHDVHLSDYCIVQFDHFIIFITERCHRLYLNMKISFVTARLT